MIQRTESEKTIRWLGLAITIVIAITGVVYGYSSLVSSVAAHERRICELEQMQRELQKSVVSIDRSLAVIASKIAAEK